MVGRSGFGSGGMGSGHQRLGGSRVRGSPTRLCKNGGGWMHGAKGFCVGVSDDLDGPTYMLCGKTITQTKTCTSIEKVTRME